jgi:transcriptional regulator with XRE-family HTH domain
MSDFRKELGMRVQQFRKRSGLTQEKLAEQIGVATETISRLEGGRALTGVETFQKIAEVLKVDLAVLFRISTSKKKDNRYRRLDQVEAMIENRKLGEIDLALDIFRQVLDGLQKIRETASKQNKKAKLKKDGTRRRN